MLFLFEELFELSLVLLLFLLLLLLFLLLELLLLFFCWLKERLKALRGPLEACMYLEVTTNTVGGMV